MASAHNCGFNKAHMDTVRYKMSKLGKNIAKTVTLCLVLVHFLCGPMFAEQTSLLTQPQTSNNSKANDTGENFFNELQCFFQQHISGKNQLIIL